MNKRLSETWSELVTIKVYTTSDSFPSSSMMLDIIKEKEIPVSHLVFEKS